MQTKKFQSEKAMLTGIVIWGTGALFLFLIVRIIIAGEFEFSNLVAFLLLGMVICMLLWLWFETNYEIKEGKLVYKSGPFRGNIEISKIQHITRDKTMWSGFKPALGLRGLIIRYNKWDDIYISPADKESFIAELLKLNSNIEIRK